jgi:hypothetical protein
MRPAKAVVRAYARKAKVKTPPLEDYEETQRAAGDKVIPLGRESRERIRALAP